MSPVLMIFVLFAFSLTFQPIIFLDLQKSFLFQKENQTYNILPGFKSGEYIYFNLFI